MRSSTAVLPTAMLTALGCTILVFVPERQIACVA